MAAKKAEKKDKKDDKDKKNEDEKDKKDGKGKKNRKGKKDTDKSDDQDNEGEGEGDNTDDASHGIPSFLKKIIILVVLLLLGGGGYFGYFYFFPGDGYSELELVHVTLPQKILRFTYNKLPNVYLGLIDLNRQLVLIDGEINRINNIEKIYPEQKKIAEKGKKVWNKFQQKLQKYLPKLEEKLEAIYVTYQVNKDKGSELIESQKQTLKENNDTAIAPAKESTDKLSTILKNNTSAIESKINQIKSFFK